MSIQKHFILIKNYNLLAFALCILMPLSSFSQYWADEVGGIFNIPAVEYNPTYTGYGSDGDLIYNKIDLQNGTTMQIVENSALYDYLGTQVATAWSSAIGWNHETDFRDGGIIASSIADIKVGNTTHTMVYAWSVNTQEGGRRSGWMKLSDLSPSNSIGNILNENKDARMEILVDGGINNATYEEYVVITAELPSEAEGYYLDPDRPDYYTAGLAKYYYTRDDYISGLKNIPETNRQRFGVAHNNIPLGAKFYKDMGEDRVEVNIYPPSSSTAISHKLQLVWGYTVTGAGEKIYSWINERTLEATEEEEEEEEEEEDNGNAFVPNPNKVYYIDCPAQNARLASTGGSEEPYTTSTNTTGNDVTWKFVAKGNGSWHIRRAAGGTKPGLRTDASSDADMQETSSNGVYTYFDFPASSTSGTYYATLPDGPSDYKRLQVDNNGNIKMVSDAFKGTWVSFKFTEATLTSTVENIAPIGSVSQSSTAYGGSASKAVDKNTDGRFWNGSVTHTNNERRPHWQVEWNDLYEIDEIKIYNRTDCCTDRLSDFKVYVIDDVSGNVTFTKEYTGEAGSILTVNTGGAKGNRVKIRLNETNALSLTEVEVFGISTGNALARSSSEASFMQASKVDGRKVGLSWRVIDSKAPMLFEIEHSKEGGEFELIETLSADSDDERKIYDLSHKYPVNGENTYRINVLFNDGSEYYLTSNTLSFEANKISKIFPNPSDGRLFVDLSDYQGEAVDLFLIDISGKVQLTRQLDGAHEPSVNLDLSVFQNGFYTLYIKAENNEAVAEKISLINMY